MSPIVTACDDPEIMRLWADYRHVIQRGNPLGMTFLEYVVARSRPRTTMSTGSNPMVVADGTRGMERGR